MVRLLLRASARRMGAPAPASADASCSTQLARFFSLEWCPPVCFLAATRSLLMRLWFHHGVCVKNKAVVYCTRIRSGVYVRSRPVSRATARCCWKKLLLLCLLACAAAGPSLLRPATGWACSVAAVSEQHNGPLSKRRLAPKMRSRRTLGGAVALLWRGLAEMSAQARPPGNTSHVAYRR